MKNIRRIIAPFILALPRRSKYARTDTIKPTRTRWESIPTVCRVSLLLINALAPFQPWLVRALEAHSARALLSANRPASRPVSVQTAGARPVKGARVAVTRQATVNFRELAGQENSTLTASSDNNL